MAAISGIVFAVQMGKFVLGDTDGDIYLGIGGREFFVDSVRDDFEVDTYREYLIGGPPIPGSPGVDQVPILHADINDPRKDFPLDTDDLSRTPVYIRFEPEDDEDDCAVSFVAALVYTDQFFIAYFTPDRFDHLFLGRRSGKILYLTSELRGQQGLTFLEARRQIHAQKGKTNPKSK